MKKKILLCLLAVIFAVNTVTVFAESAEITASVTNVGRYVSITGNITSGSGKNISIEVLDPVQNYAYVNQIKSGADGNFSISFMLKESAVHGLYFVFVGGEGVQSPASDIFSYMGEETPEPEPEPEPEPGDELITAEATNAGRYVSITGNITSGAGKNISIEVRDPVQNYAYVNQIRSGADGNFSISFMLKESAVHGLYFVFVGGEGVQSPASDIFSYMGEETPEPEPEPVPATITSEVTNTGKNVTVTGNITSGEGKNIFVVVQDPKQNVVYENQIVSGAGGNFSINFSLAENAAGGLYFVILNGDGVENPVYNLFSYMGGSEPAPAIITAEVTNTGKNVTVTGNISTGEGKQITLDVKDENDNVIYQGQTESVAEGSFVITFSLPETAEEGIYNITVSGTNVDVPVNLSFIYVDGNAIFKYNVDGKANDVINIIVTGKNISSFNEKVFILRYDHTNMELLNLYGTEYIDCIEPSVMDDIEILSYQPGEITFKFTGFEQQENKLWSGILNIFKFKFINDFSGLITITSD